MRRAQIQRAFSEMSLQVLSSEVECDTFKMPPRRALPDVLEAVQRKLGEEMALHKWPGSELTLTWR